MEAEAFLAAIKDVKLADGCNRLVRHSCPKEGENDAMDNRRHRRYRGVTKPLKSDAIMGLAMQKVSSSR
jgi:hypothetical protein